MAFSKLVEFISHLSNRVSAPKASVHGYADSVSEKRANLRHASSLQEFPIYHQVDLDVDPYPIVGKRSIHATNLLGQENLSSSFSKDKAPPSYTQGKRWFKVICVFLCLLLLACLCFGLLVLYLKWFGGSSKFYVVIDCGSTGNRVYVYEASVNTEKSNSLPILVKSFPESAERRPGSQMWRAYNRMETEPGLDKLVNNVSGLKKAIKPLIKWAEKQIPLKSHKNTSLFLYATAGVRRLPRSDSDWLLHNSWSILKNSQFSCKREWIKIITGMEEAYYGWIALNYHSGVLGSIPIKETFGALDLGGSSLQVTFEGTQKDDEETNLNLKIGPVEHHLGAYSLAGYGLNDAFDKSVARLASKLTNVSDVDLAQGKVQVKHPCLQSGYKEIYSCTQCEPILLKDTSPSIATNHGKGSQADVSVQLIGSPNWDKCSALAKTAVNVSEWSDNSPAIDCQVHPCAITKDQPRPVGNFYAMSGFYVVYRFFNLTSDASLDDLLEKGREYCEKTWDDARKSVPPQPFIEQYCFRTPYIVLLLREGLHISDDHVTIGSGSITWTLGVALVEAGNSFSHQKSIYNYQSLTAKIDPRVVLIIFLASLFILFCALSCTVNWCSKHRWPCLPLFKHNSVVSSSLLSIPAPFRFQRWSPVSTGDGRAKMPLSPTVGNDAPRPFNGGVSFNDEIIPFTDLALCSSSSRVPHSYSSGSLGQMQFDNRNFWTPHKFDNRNFWTPHRSNMILQSRRSQSREDLNTSLAELQLAKV